MKGLDYIYLLLAFALTIMLFYFYYVLKILIAKADTFEFVLMESFINWLIVNKQSSKMKSYLLIALSICLEVLYFVLVILFIDNKVIIFYTILLITFECLHLVTSIYSFNQFFKSKRKLSNLFNWRLERSAALLIFTHNILTIAYIINYLI